MEKRERAGNGVLKRIKNDYVFRTFIFSALSFFVTLAFSVYNTFLGIAHKSVWNIGIAIYYALLLCIRAYIIFSERKLYKKNLTDEQKEKKRKKLFFVQSILLLIVDFALIAPISLMVLQKRTINFSEIPAIAMAGYTSFKIFISTRNIIKTRYEINLGIKMLRNINFIDALVSILSLQYTLIMTFGGGSDEDMFTLCAVSSFFIYVLLFVLSLKTFLSSVKIITNNKT